MTRLNRQQRRFRLSWPLVLVLSLSVLAQPVLAKQILKGVEASENRVFIRTDGLACYFCAYGLERFFKKTGRIAAFDMNMKEGIVTAVFVRGEPLVPPETLSRFVHDAGFAPRWIDAELVGPLEIDADGSAVLRVRETDERIPLESTAPLSEFLEGEWAGADVRVLGRTREDEGSHWRLAPTSISKEGSSP